MLFAEISDQAWNALIAAITGLVLALIQVVTSQRNKTAIDESSRKADVHADVAASKLEKNTEVTEATHVLVNNNFAVQLQAISVLSHRLAVLTRDPLDVEAADTADRLLAEHLAKQSVVDQGESHA